MSWAYGGGSPVGVWDDAHVGLVVGEGGCVSFERRGTHSSAARRLPEVAGSCSSQRTILLQPGGGRLRGSPTKGICVRSHTVKPPSLLCGCRPALAAHPLPE